MNNDVRIPRALFQRAQDYCNRITDLLADPNKESRKRDVVTARMMVAGRLLREGYSEHQIGKVLGIDHSSVNHYRKRLAEILTTKGYEDEQEIWKQFNI